MPFNLEKLSGLPIDLVVPELQSRFDSVTNPRHKLALAFALANYGFVNQDYLLSRMGDLSEADTRNYIIALRCDRSASLEAVETELAKCTEKSLWRRKAKLAVLALNLGKISYASEMCAIENCPDPQQRSLFIDEYSRWQNDLDSIYEQLLVHDHPATRSAVLFGIGSIENEALNDAAKERWRNFATRLYLDADDAVTHSAANWLLRNGDIASGSFFRFKRNL